MSVEVKPRRKGSREMWARLFNKNVESSNDSVVQGMTDSSEMCWIGDGLGVRARAGRSQCWCLAMLWLSSGHTPGVDTGHRQGFHLSGGSDVLAPAAAVHMDGMKQVQKTKDPDKQESVCGFAS
jgi:hypothetical protein